MSNRSSSSSGSSSSPRPPRSPGISRYGRSGLDAQQFHSGPIAAKAAAKAIVLRVRRKLHRHGHCGRCDARLVGGKCPSCGYDPRHDGDLDDDEHDIDDVGLLGDDLNRRGRFDLNSS